MEAYDSFVEMLMWEVASTGPGDGSIWGRMEKTEMGVSVCFFKTQIMGFFLSFTGHNWPASSPYSSFISWFSPSSPHHVLFLYLSNISNLDPCFLMHFLLFFSSYPPVLNPQTQVLSILQTGSSYTVGFLFSCPLRGPHPFKASHFSKWATSLLTATRINVLTLMSREKWVMVGPPGCYLGMWFTPVLKTDSDHAAAAFLGPFVARGLPKGKSCLIESYRRPNAHCLEITLSGIS